MAVFSGPEIVNNGLVFYYDVSNTQRSWKGAPVTNLAKNSSNNIDWTIGNLTQAVSRSVVTDNEVYRITSTSLSGTSFRIGFPNAALVNNATYTVSYIYKIISGGPLFRANDWCDTSIIRTTTEIGNSSFYETATGTRSTYDSTYRFLDFEMSNNTIVEIKNFQLEERAFATPYSSNQTRTNTQAILDLSGNNVITATSLSYHANNTFTFDGANNYIQISKTRTGLGITNTYSLEAVFRRSSNLGGKIILGGQGYNWGIMTTTNGCRAEHWYSSDGGTVWNYFTTGDAVAPINTWTHVVATFNHLGNMCTYINGRLVITANMSAYTNNWMNTPICIGGYNYFDYRFNGLIPLAKVYNRELTANEISQNFEAIRGRYGI